MKAIQRKQSGFTLIELMIVIAIIAILVALALPAYRDFTVRTKVGECIDAGAPIKLNIAEHYDSVGVIPDTTDKAGVDATATSQWCLAVSYAIGTGAFTINADPAKIQSGTSGTIAATFTPVVNSAGGLDWNCTNVSVPVSNAKYLPAPCRG